MAKLVIDGEYFNVLDTLTCGQLFRYEKVGDKFALYSKDKCALLYQENDTAVILCPNGEEEYFYNYFDLDRDYKLIVDGVEKYNNAFLSYTARIGKGIRIVNQDEQEALFSFIVSQNNNIPRIRKIIFALCRELGERKEFEGIEYYTFPSATAMAQQDINFFKKIGLGYRAEYIKKLAQDIANGLDVYSFNTLTTAQLKQKLTSLYGVGPKVADCVSLFGYHRADSFPVDTWIEKLYHENFGGKETDRNKITKFFLQQFGENSGYYQQYMFYYKRSLEKEEKH